MKRRIIVQKYGGSSVATTDRIRAIARAVCRRRAEGFDLVVVVSAMGDATDELLARAKEVAAEPDRRELDMLLSVGERISMSLLAMAIREEGAQAVSLTGSQSGIVTTASHTNARIIEVRPFRVQDELEADRVVIVAGYQGVSYKRDITTLGRGGSDTTAVALAAALDAEACEIYSDVDGVLSADPRVVSSAAPLPTIGYAEMQELAEGGARVLNAQAVEFAKTRGIAIYARRTGSTSLGTVVGRPAPQAPDGGGGLAPHEQIAAVFAAGVPADALDRLLADLEAAGVRARQLHHQVDASGRDALSCLVDLDDLHARQSWEERLGAYLGPHALRFDLGAISLVGEGITRTPQVLRTARDTVHDAGVRLAGVSTSSFRITFLVPSEAVLDTVRRLHTRLGLDAPSAEAVLA